MLAALAACKTPVQLEKTVYIHDTVVVHKIKADTIFDSVLVVRNNIIHDTVLIVKTKFATAKAKLYKGNLSVQLVQKDTALADTVRVSQVQNIYTQHQRPYTHLEVGIIFLIVVAFILLILYILRIASK
jgi:hypothetical protein